MRNKFIVIEGTDGSGKTEQFKYLIQRLKAKKIHFKVVDFPQYGKPSAYFVEKYLRGEYGTLKQVGPYLASLFYALDRYDIANKMKKWLVKGNIVLSNRYVASNLGHQGSKIRDRKKRIEFYHWINNLEYKILGVPKPELNIFLHMPTKIAYKLIANKSKRKYLKGKKRDIQESNIKYLKQSEKRYLEIVKLFPKDFIVIECAPLNKLLSIEEISQKIWQVVKKLI